MCGAIVSVVQNTPIAPCDYAQDVRYIAIEHMDVRRDCLSFAKPQRNRDRLRRSLLQLHPASPPMHKTTGTENSKNYLHTFTLALTLG
jgi:hypothetical protein